MGRVLQLAVLTVLVGLTAVALHLGVNKGLTPLELPTRVVGPPRCEGLPSHGRDMQAQVRGAQFTAITEANDGGSCTASEHVLGL